MCGIAGRVNLDGQPVDPALVLQMTRLLAHRGPDGEGFHVDGPVGLGSRRLSIIDVVGGTQPIGNEDGTVQIVLNGEIYNFRELRSELERSGHRFATRSDTEVIVHLYEERGEACVGALRGMFAFALWDAPRRRLLLARDRLGEKPLYYAHRAGRSLTFGSEMKAVLADPTVPRELDLEALDRYLSLLYIPAPQSIFRDVRKLPAGHLLLADPQGVVVRQYWDLAPAQLSSGTDHAEELLQRLTDAVRSEMVSDVPLGAFLSGGIDSSTIVALMAQAASSPVVTTTVGFRDSRYDERPWARAVARHLHCDARESEVTPAIEEVLPKLAWHFDEPFADSSAVPTYYVSQMARRHVTVALSGDGGDELLAGYARHFWDRWEGRARRLALPAGLTSTLARAWPESLRGRNAVIHLGMSPDEACARKHSAELFRDDERRDLYSEELLAATRDFDPLAVHRAYHRRFDTADPLHRSLYVDVKTYLADDILVKVDRMSMAHGLEVRPPFLDYRLVEFIMALPSRLKLRRRTTKFLLRQVMRPFLPAEVFARQKRGFEAPIGRWLREDLRPFVEDTLFSPRARQRELFDLDVVERLWKDHVTGVRSAGHRLWLLLMLELWFRRFVDRNPALDTP